MRTGDDVNCSELELSMFSEKTINRNDLVGLLERVS